MGGASKAGQLDFFVWPAVKHFRVFFPAVWDGHVPTCDGMVRWEMDMCRHVPARCAQVEWLGFGLQPERCAADNRELDRRRRQRVGRL